MVIDDNEFDCYITARLVSNTNLASEVLEFNSGEVALQYLVENQNDLTMLPELIFLDIYMPLMDGFDFINMFRLLPDEVTNHCEICIVSTTVDDFHIHKAKIDESIRLFTSKPITVEFLESLSTN
ncbi:response regulator of ato, ornithine decarboxylase antizyme (sensor ATOS) [Flavobacterium limnosediminis JC2902]|uniref:Response regulator of ato, ornithine decarboxylase antizyme (Sensor ATOS) n=2 Tax=Flavobacterium TaxID=237 RepID=V6SKM6_9FLAO|nr:response regulator of ato, ornithine decarboxylase antizyme (sensor ATOS) [Flavobacterium limnosediminis JC2902]